MTDLSVDFFFLKLALLCLWNLSPICIMNWFSKACGLINKAKSFHQRDRVVLGNLVWRKLFQLIASGFEFVIFYYLKISRLIIIAHGCK